MKLISIVTALIGVVGLFCGWASPCQAQQPIAVIVSHKTSIADLPLEELRRLYLGSATRLSNGERVILLEHPEERAAFYKAVLGMNEDRVKRHWISLVFSGDPVAPPRELADEEQLKRFVAEHPGAIAFLSPGAVDQTVRVLAIDGLRPADSAYPLRSKERSQ